MTFIIPNRLHCRVVLAAFLALAAAPIPTMRGALNEAEVAPAPDKEQIDFFEKQIRPVLASKCYKCHSAEADKIKGGLLLDTREGIREGGDSGHAVVPG